MSSCCNYPFCTLGSDSRNPQESIVISLIHFHWKFFQMLHCPLTLWINIFIKIRILFRQKFPCFKSIEPEKEICLVQSVLSFQGRTLQYRWQSFITVYIHKRRIKNPLQFKPIVQGLCNRHYLVIRLSSCPYYHLCTLTCRHKIPVRSS